MKLFKQTTILLAAFALMAVSFTSCHKTGTEEADLTELQSVIDSCKTVLKNATTADYPQSAITSFQSTLTAVEDAISDTSTLTQTAVDNLVVQLRAAASTFAGTAYDVIPTDALTFGLSFDEGTGTSLKTSGKYSWTATLEKGPSEIFGTATNVPSFIDGKVGKAMYFSNGAHLEIDDYVASALEGKQLSIACWLKPDSTRAGNYIISYNYWNTWKLCLQTENKPFFTVKTTEGCVDMDNENANSVPNGSWTHVVVTMDLDAEKVDFYINGVLTKEWTNTTKPGISGSVASYATKLPLLIGVCTTYDEALTWSWDWAHEPASWDSYIGSIDELKVYNIALTEGQVAKLYGDEE
ncbi:MAG: LamG domain-containing protein [Bacteroidales bacterium]|jgi:hypothetical protein|nr:LamG domain-containing protein [Bacteroidales bacterium]MCI2121902.1 LamG domain-containing protein [Bacteroidales bacterium]MCI2145522.1 LamG domain-containing protein [Bacteroidales bacterium]